MNFVQGAFPASYLFHLPFLLTLELTSRGMFPHKVFIQHDFLSAPAVFSGLSPTYTLSKFGANRLRWLRDMTSKYHHVQPFFNIKNDSFSSFLN